ncbi:hypothetical protein FHW58_001624 [Duganella sp. 1224]|uniref:hypothetical protein n=1 Tax=Duganella sp. 1224 TaxID=2587052 RepID=UPI0015C8242F|nr:hypothetical protein [Duganella sp. 1224]NYE60472.1 hypothetical protein [Duganella sp. 1224]
MSTNPVTGKKKTAPAIALPYWITEFALIRTAFLTLVAAITISLTGVLLSELKKQDASETLETTQRARDAAASRYAQVDSEKRDIRNFQQRFVALRQRGLVGDERRLEWLDAIRQTQEQLKLAPLSYEIEPQQTVRLESPLDLGDFELRGSRMRLHMELLHELDLFNFFQTLRQRSYFAVQDCSIKRLGVVAGAAGAPTLGADCTLNWITLNTAPKAPRLAALKPQKGRS